MFKITSISLMNGTHFGVGSTISGGTGYLWLVIGACKGTDSVRLLNMHTMIPCTKLVGVSDINHLTEIEARELTSTTEFIWTFSDYTLNSEGFKSYD